MSSLFEILGLDSETSSQRLARELAQTDLDLIAALKRVRERRGLSQRELGELLGLTQATVSSFESCESEPKLSTVRRYAHALGASVRHSVVADGQEFASADFASAMWTPRNPIARSVTELGQIPVELGPIAAKKQSDFAVAA